MDKDRGSRDRTAEDRDAAQVLAPFFAAARDEPPEPSVTLLSAILADAAGAAASRRAPPHAPARWRDAVAPALGGWRGATALAACALIGFWLGIAGGITIDGTTLEAGTALASADAGTDPVEALLDLAAAE
jgi:hypothetical protein